MQTLKSFVPLSLKMKAHALVDNVSSVARDISFWPNRVSQRLRGTPLPPSNLMFVIAQHRNTDIFLRSGEVSAQQIRAMLKRNGLELEGFDAMLDFGCGVGRVVRQWKDLKGPEVHGTDYNPLLIDWCRKHLTFAHFQCNTLAAELKYEDQKFDFTYAFSVFTHLPEGLADAWLKELGRVLKPGGYLYLTTHGSHYFPSRTPSERERLARGELVILETDRAGSNDCAVFHPEAYIREHWGAEFAIVDFRPGQTGLAAEQDAWLLRKA